MLVCYGEVKDDIINVAEACDAAYLHCLSCLQLQCCTSDALQDKELKNDVWQPPTLILSRLPANAPSSRKGCCKKRIGYLWTLA